MVEFSSTDDARSPTDDDDDGFRHQDSDEIFLVSIRHKIIRSVSVSVSVSLAFSDVVRGG